MTARILVFSGSIRAASLNTKLARLGAEAIAKAGGQATLISLADYPMPIYDGDLEAASGIPANAMALKQLFKQHHGFFIASPENNSSVSALLKNTIDWVSRTTGSEPGKVPYQGKVVAMASATPSAAAGVRGMMQLRLILTGLGCWMLPDQLGVGQGTTAFAEDGSFKDPKHHAALAVLATALVQSAEKFGVAQAPA